MRLDPTALEPYGPRPADEIGHQPDGKQQHTDKQRRHQRIPATGVEVGRDGRTGGAKPRRRSIRSLHGLPGGESVALLLTLGVRSGDEAVIRERALGTDHLA